MSSTGILGLDPASAISTLNSRMNSVSTNNSAVFGNSLLETNITGRLTQAKNTVEALLGIPVADPPAAMSNARSVINLTGNPAGYDGSLTPTTISSDSGFMAYMIETRTPQNTGKLSTKDSIGQKQIVRRPVLGTVPKENSFASIFLTDESSTGAPLPSQSAKLYNSLNDTNNTPSDSITFNFLLQGMSQNYLENAQILQTFGKTYFFFFGQKPMAIVANGLLLNSRNFNWRNDMIRNYQEKLRGTMANKLKTKVVFTYDDIIYTGYILTMALMEDAENIELCQFTFEMVVTQMFLVPSYDYTKYKSSLDSKNLKQEYYEYVGPFGAATKNGVSPERKAIFLHSTFADALGRYVGFTLRSINQMKSLSNLIFNSSSKTKSAVLLAGLSEGDRTKGATIFELDRVMRNI